MKIFRNFICVLVLAACVSSCSITRNRTYSPAVTQLNVHMDDLEYLGETEITVEYRTYLGFINVVDKINGELYDGKEIKTLVISNGNCSTSLVGKLDRASYKLAEEFPGADYFIVAGQSMTRDILFLGGHVTAKAKVKAYSFR